MGQECWHAAASGLVSGDDRGLPSVRVAVQGMEHNVLGKQGQRVLLMTVMQRENSDSKRFRWASMKTQDQVRESGSG